jgi:hypothetical protein
VKDQNGDAPYRTRHPKSFDSASALDMPDFNRILKKPLRLLPPVDIAVEDPLDFHAFAGGFVENQPPIEGRRQFKAGVQKVDKSAIGIFGVRQA